MARGEEQIQEEQDDDPGTRLLSQSIVNFLHDEGRVVVLEELTTKLLYEPEMEGIVNKAGQSGKDITDYVFQFIEPQKMLFYTILYNERVYVALSRDMAYIYPRFCSVIQNDDPQRDELLFGTESLQFADNEVSIFSYEYLKCVITITEILDSLFRCFKLKDTNVPMEEAIGECDHVRFTVRHLMDFCAAERTPAFKLKRFLTFIGSAFTFDASYVHINRNLYHVLRECFELDLVWSYSEACVFNGCSDISTLTKKIAEFAVRVGFHRVTTMTNDWVENFLGGLGEVFFCPGDGSVWLMETCLISRIAEEKLQDLCDFFEQHAKNSGPFMFSDCYSILSQNDPQLFESFKDESHITIAYYLYKRPYLFCFKKGMVSIPRYDEFNCSMEVIPVEVPTFMEHDRPIRPPMFNSTRGEVVEVGGKSAVLRAFNKEPMDKSREARLCYAFCHVSVTTYNGNRIERFDNLFDVDDVLIFNFLYSATLRPERPFFLTVLDILGTLEPKTQSSTERLSSLSSCSSLASLTSLTEKTARCSVQETCNKNNMIAYVQTVLEEGKPTIPSLSRHCDNPFKALSPQSPKSNNINKKKLFVDCCFSEDEELLKRDLRQVLHLIICFFRETLPSMLEKIDQALEKCAPEDGLLLTLSRGESQIISEIPIDEEQSAETSISGKVMVDEEIQEPITEPLETPTEGTDISEPQIKSAVEKLTESSAAPSQEKSSLLTATGECTAATGAIPKKIRAEPSESSVSLKLGSKRRFDQTGMPVVEVEKMKTRKPEDTESQQETFTALESSIGQLSVEAPPLEEKSLPSSTTESSEPIAEEDESKVVKEPSSSVQTEEHSPEFHLMVQLLFLYRKAYFDLGYETVIVMNQKCAQIAQRCAVLETELRVLNEPRDIIENLKIPDLQITWRYYRSREENDWEVPCLAGFSVDGQNTKDNVDESSCTIEPKPTDAQQDSTQQHTDECQQEQQRESTEEKILE